MSPWTTAFTSSASSAKCAPIAAPGRAIVRDKVWWRGVEKNKLIYERCRPVMARYEGCAVCMKTCPIQRFGMPAVMEHYVETGKVLGKGTHLLEGYTFKEKGYHGPGELPQFDRQFFEIPHGRKEDWLFEQFKERLMNEGVPEEGEPAGIRAAGQGHPGSGELDHRR